MLISATKYTVQVFIPVARPLGSVMSLVRSVSENGHFQSRKYQLMFQCVQNSRMNL